MSLGMTTVLNKILVHNIILARCTSKSTTSLIILNTFRHTISMYNSFSDDVKVWNGYFDIV